MVKSVSSLTRNGLKDWLIQHLTAFLMAVYLLFLVGYCATHPIDFYAWHSLFTNNVMRISTFLFFFFLALHAWIGLWTVATDYLKNTFIRFLFLLLVFLVLISTIIWSIEILWSL